MKKILGIVFLVLGLMFVGGPIFSLIGAGCSVAQSTTAYADVTTNADGETVLTEYTVSVPVICAFGTLQYVSDLQITIPRIFQLSVINNTTNTWKINYMNTASTRQTLQYWLPSTPDQNKVNLCYFNHSTATFKEYLTVFKWSLFDTDNNGITAGSVELDTLSIVSYGIDFYDGDYLYRMSFEFKDYILSLDMYSPGNTIYWIPDTITVPFAGGNEYGAGYAIGELRGFANGEAYGYQNGYHDGFYFGEQQGINTALGDINPFAFVLDTADRFFEISPFGNNITFGYILSIGFGLVLIGITIKVFLGG